MKLLLTPHAAGSSPRRCDTGGVDHLEVGRYWEENADTWARLVQAGCDLYRDLLNTPAFLEMLPDVRGLLGLDVGCGEGHNTRQLEGRGARMVGIDIAPAFVRFARNEGLSCLIGSAQSLPFAENSFDFVTAFMSLMDMPGLESVLREALRVVRPGGFLQFSISHPCFMTPHRRNLRNAEGKPYAVEVGRYFERTQGEIEEWMFSGAPAEARASLPRFRIPVFHRTVSEWLNAVVEAGFQLERLGEPCVDRETAQRHPIVEDAGVVAYFLHVRCRKPVRY
jgi:SAM-dependent methyltransferase